MSDNDSCDAFACVENVVIDGLVVLKIVKHCKEALPAIVSGKLLGLEFDSKVEVTNSFAMPSSSDENEDNSAYQLDMMKALRALNQDHVTVGWYQTASFDSFINSTTVQIQYQHQAEISNSIMLIHDPYCTAEGQLGLKAYRLTDRFMEFFQKGQFTQSNYSQAGITSADIFEEIPISIHNSHLIRAFLSGLPAAPAAGHMQSVTAKTFGLMSDAIEEFTKDQTAFSQYLRNAGRQHAQQQAFLAKRRAENQQRTAHGDAPLDDDLSKNSLFKAIPAPSRSDRMLLCQQLAHYCAAVDDSRDVLEALSH